MQLILEGRGACDFSLFVITKLAYTSTTRTDGKRKIASLYLKLAAAVVPW